MKLLLKRSQRNAGLMGGKVAFALDARIELSTEDQSLVKKYNLGKTSLYDSETRKKHAESAMGHIDASQSSGVGGQVYRLGRAYASLALSALSLRVTVDSLMGGQHIECKDLDELLGAEAAIRDACKNIKAYLETAVMFDGREEVVEF